jgi:endonuclease III
MSDGERDRYIYLSARYRVWVSVSNSFLRHGQCVCHTVAFAVDDCPITAVCQL